MMISRVPNLLTMKIKPIGTWIVYWKTLVSLTTHSIAVTVVNHYLQVQGPSDQPQFIFGYDVTIENRSNETVRLVEREWIITNAFGEIKTVMGEGVIGVQPTLAPGETFSYSSYCPLSSPFGMMEGFYVFSNGGISFRVAIPRFFMQCFANLN